jgi:hypothetical protein
MSRALLPWLFPLAMLLGVAIAATGSILVAAVAAVVLGFGVLPFVAAYARRNGLWPRGLGGGSDPPERRFPGM